MGLQIRCIVRLRLYSLWFIPPSQGHLIDLLLGLDFLKILPMPKRFVILSRSPVWIRNLLHDLWFAGFRPRSTNRTFWRLKQHRNLFLPHLHLRYLKLLKHLSFGLYRWYRTILTVYLLQGLYVHWSVVWFLRYLFPLYGSCWFQLWNRTRVTVQLIMNLLLWFLH